MAAAADGPREADDGDRPVLEMRGIVRTFPGVRALDGVDLVLRPGQVHALMGQNGAGKSTLIHVLTGALRPDAGEMRLLGRPYRPRSPADAARLGVGAVYQEINLVPQLSVAENLFLGREPMRRAGIDWRAVRASARRALERLGLSIDVTRAVGEYPIAVRQMVAIARALDVQARVLVLDEPTSSLGAAETARLFDLLRALKSRGLSLVFVTHFLDQVYAVSDRITVLRNGRLVGEYSPAELPRAALVARMLGHDDGAPPPVQDRAPPTVAIAEPVPGAGGPADPHTPAAHPGAGARRAIGDVVLRAVGLGRRGALSPTDLEIRAGQTLGLAGLLGSGRTQLARLLFGIDRPDAGRIELDGRPVALRSPRAAVRRRLGFCPEDRRAEGLIPGLSVRENVLLALQARRGWARRLGRTAQRRIADELIRSLNVALADADQPVETLSGGNQQKVILARWLASSPRVLILDEPTRGIDVGARAEIERLIVSLADAGVALLLIPSELEELPRTCHRVAVMRARAKVGELSGERLQPSVIMHMIAG